MVSNFSSVNNIYQKLGGREFIEALVRTFYAKVTIDPVLKPLFDQAEKLLGTNIEERIKIQILFLSQRFGGPRTYEIERGHPRLRKRHQPYRISETERNRWLYHMINSLEETGITSDHLLRKALEDYFNKTATHMINVKSSSILGSF